MKRILIIVAALIIVAFVLSLTVPAPASAQAPPEIPEATYQSAAEFQASTEYGCTTYGCLYSHERACHYTREGSPCPGPDLGIAHEWLPDGEGVTAMYPEGRRFERVMWPHRYDPARRYAWDRLAQCESTGNWYINTGNGYYGGVQFSLSSWRAAGGQQYAAYPHHALPEQQIATAEVLLSMQGRGAWPGCLRKGQGAPYPQ